MSAKAIEPKPAAAPNVATAAAAGHSSTVTVLAPSIPRLSGAATQTTATRSGLSSHPARSKASASRSRACAPPGAFAHSGAEGAVWGFWACLRRASHCDASRGAAPSPACSTDRPTSAPAPKDIATKRLSATRQPHADHSGQAKQSPDPPVAERHHSEHRQEKRLTGGLVERIQVWGMERRHHHQESDWKRNDDGRSRARLDLERLGFTLDLLDSGYGCLEIDEQRRELTAARSLDEHCGGKEVEQRLGDALARGRPCVIASTGRGGNASKLVPQRRGSTLAKDGDRLLHPGCARLE